MTDQVEPSRARVGQVIDDEVLAVIVAGIQAFLEYEALEAAERQRETLKRGGPFLGDRGGRPIIAGFLSSAFRRFHN